MNEISKAAVLEFFQQRRSVPSRHLAAPGPSPETLQQMLTLAVRVPDHGKLAPWRFLVIEGEARARMGALLVARKRSLEPDASVDTLKKEFERFSFAPVIVTVIAKVLPDHKIPVQEQLLSGGALCMQLLQLAQAFGFSAQWLTGWAAYDQTIGHELGLRVHESVLGFIHIGSSSADAAERLRPDVSQLITRFSA
jgi:nitroreductase